jgi:hypothetical protein
MSSRHHSLHAGPILLRAPCVEKQVSQEMRAFFSVRDRFVAFASR